MNPRERRMLMILGGVAGAALLFFLVNTFILGGEAPEEDIGVTPPIAVPSPIPTVSPTPKLPPLAIFGGRDPFFPLILPDDLTGDGGATPTPTGSPNPSVSPAPSPGGGDGIGGHDVRVLDVFIRGGEELVQVEVDGDVFTVGEGDTFAGNFRVVSIDGGCATFLFGDEQFTRCEPGAQK